MSKKLQKLYKKLGYEFSNESLIDVALTHRSVSKENYERLEFLGDAMLSLIIAKELYKRYPHIKEGELSRMRSNLVKGVTLSQVAREFQLGDFLNLGVGELKTGGFDRDSILADAFEAILGAMFLDSDYQTCKDCVVKWFESRLSDPNLLVKLKDPKTRLQEFLQARQMSLPEYDIVKVKGDPHEQIFTISCRVPGVSHKTISSDTTRRQAEQKAAKQFIIWLEQEDD